MSDKYRDTIAASNVSADEAKIKAAVAKIIADHLEENKNQDVYKFLFNSIDLTTLNSTDSSQSVAKLVERVNAFAWDNDENIWIGTQTGGVYVLNREATEILEHYTCDNSEG